MDGRVLRLDAFRSLRPAYDELLRGELVAELLGMPGLADAYAARQGPDDAGPRLVATVWSTEAAMVAAIGAGFGASHPQHVESTTDQRRETVPLLVGHRYLPTAGPLILRLLRGRVRPGELAAYAQDVDHGADEDAHRENGPVAVYMGGVATEGPEAFVTLSAWREWTDIEAATGGDIHRPRATRQPERLAEWDVEHFEIVAAP
jgi:heme-degrading monooxygenase HmoA